MQAHIESDDVPADQRMHARKCSLASKIGATLHAKARDVLVGRGRQSLECPLNMAALKQSVQRRPCQIRYASWQRIATVVKRQKRVLAERDAQDGLPTAPLYDRLGIEAVGLG